MVSKLNNIFGKQAASAPRTQKQALVYKEPQTVEEAVELLKQNYSNAETCEKLLKKLSDLTEDDGKKNLFWTLTYFISFRRQQD